MTSQTHQQEVPELVERLAPGCGYSCPDRDWVSGACERHGPTSADMIVKRIVNGFRNDLRAIMRDNRDEQ